MPADLQSILQQDNPDDEEIDRAGVLFYSLLKDKQQKVRGGGDDDAAVGEPSKKMQKHEALSSAAAKIDVHLQGINSVKSLCDAMAQELDNERYGLVAVKERIENIIADM